MGAGKSNFFRPNGSLTQFAKGIATVPKEDRPAFGKSLNQAKGQVESLFQKSLIAIEELKDLKSLGDRIDPYPSLFPSFMGGLHPLTKTRRKIISIFRKIGFTVAEASEVETEWFCFDALNTPDDHPARDEQDTLFLNPESKWANVQRKKDESYLLRTHFIGTNPDYASRETSSSGNCTGQVLPEGHGGCNTLRKLSSDRGIIY